MTNERLQEIEDMWTQASGKSLHPELSELIAAVRELQTPLAELLWPTLHALTEASFGLHDAGLEGKIAVVELELDRLRALCASEKGNP